MASGCCGGRRREDGFVDSSAVLRAFDGQPARLSPSERRTVVWALTYRKRWGPQQIADHLGCHKSLVTSILQDIRRQAS